MDSGKINLNYVFNFFQRQIFINHKNLPKLKLASLDKKINSKEKIKKELFIPLQASKRNKSLALMLI